MLQEEESPQKVKKKVTNSERTIAVRSEMPKRREQACSAGTREHGTAGSQSAAREEAPAPAEKLPPALGEHTPSATHREPGLGSCRQLFVAVRNN